MNCVRGCKVALHCLHLSWPFRGLFVVAQCTVLGLHSSDCSSRIAVYNLRDGSHLLHSAHHGVAITQHCLNAIKDQILRRVALTIC